MEEEERWRWVSDGSDIDVTRFASSGQLPDGPIEDCLVMFGNGMGDEICSKYFPFFCGN